MRRVNSKKGAEMSLNVIIVAILAVLVLVVVAAFFTGGFAKLMEQIFGTGVTKLETATASCESSCNNAELLNVKENSKYCEETWLVDGNGDGEADKMPDGSKIRYHCWEDPINVQCGGVKEYCLAA